MPSMTAFRDRIARALYLHYRLMVYGIICIGGLVALSAVYVFLFTTPPVITTQEDVKDVSVQKETIESIILWGRKKLSQGAPIVVPSNVFAVPTPPPLP